ncbi:hypothetical protein [Salegentibacter maritimus]|uniref:hypothetical protein n=1 Tax=Salegentibacter maritimus TaxID=2794347 RepID=UPI0018E48EDB|nr:hypothetical protein [Salegentibacter maritimus]MBI6118350.1 hypothetical protein [Salegentibacter maritimus]
MNFKQINLRKVKKENLIEEIINKNFELPSLKDKKEIQKIINSSIQTAQYSIAINSLILGIYFDYKNTFQNIRRKGTMRYSKYMNKKCIVSNLSADLLEINSSTSFLLATEKNYLESISNLSNLRNSYQELNVFIIKETKWFEKKYKNKSILKSLLVYADFLFLSNHYPESNEDPMDINCRSKEDVCSAISYLIYFISDFKRIKPIDTAFVSEEFIKSGEIGRIIVAACFISDFKEFEILIDHFNYQCKLNEKTLKIIPPSKDFEKSIRLGYIRNELQNINDTLFVLEQENAKENQSLVELVEKITEVKDFNFFKLTESYGYSRYRVEIPEVIYHFILDNFFKPNTLFQEEVVYLAKIFKEQLLNPEDLEKIKIKDELTLMEFIKIGRVFSLFYLLFSKEIFKMEDPDSDILLRSLIPVYLEDELYDFIEKLTSTQNIDTFLDLVCWEPGLDILFDLQYHSIIFINNRFFVPLSIMVNSNSIRNLFASEYKQNNKSLLSDGSVDALVEKLNKSFNNAGITNFKETSIPNSDIDLFAIYEDTLFLFECKQSLHPVSAFDLRTTFDYIKKAESQLDNLNHLYNDFDLSSLLERKYGIDLSKVENVISCIVLSNRMFNGNVFRYPVRYINEITNMLEKGIMRTNEGEFSLWKGEELTLSDLKNYFSLDNQLTKLHLDSLSVRTVSYDLTNPPIEFDSYYMDSEVAIPKLNKFTSTLRKVR